MFQLCNVLCLEPFALLLCNFWISSGHSAGAFFPTSFILPLHSSLDYIMQQWFLAHVLTTRLHFLTVSNIVLVSFTLCINSSLLILSTQLIFSILLLIHISIACNLFLSASVTVHDSAVYNTTFHDTLFIILFFNRILIFAMNSFFICTNTCLSSSILRRISVPQHPSAEITLYKYYNNNFQWPRHSHFLHKCHNLLLFTLLPF